MAAVILYKDKKLGKTLRYDFTNRTLELFDYRAKKVKGLTLEELVKTVDEKGKERFFNSTDMEFCSRIETASSEKDYSLSRILKNVSRFNPQIKTNSTITPLEVKGLEALVEKELRRRISPGSTNSDFNFKKLKYTITCELLINLEKRYYMNDDIPSILSVKKIIQELIEKHQSTDEKEIED